MFNIWDSSDCESRARKSFDIASKWVSHDFLTSVDWQYTKIVEKMCHIANDIWNVVASCKHSEIKSSDSNKPHFKGQPLQMIGIDHHYNLINLQKIWAL